MATIRVNECELYYEESGSGPETILFSHGYLMTHEMYAAQVAALSDQFRCIVYEHRGHGRSEVTENGYEMENLYADAVAFIEALNCGPCHFVGMSTGGFIGLRLGIRRPNLVQSLCLIDTSAEAEDKNSLRRYNLLLFLVRYLGWNPVIGQGMASLFGPEFLKDPARQAERDKWRQKITSQDRMAMVRFGKGIFGRESVFDQLDQINMPTAVIVGEKDVATPPEHSQRMAAAIDGANLTLIPRAGHTSPVEEPVAVNAVMQQFYAQLG